MDIQIRDLANNIGTSVEDLQQLLKTDEAYVDRLISQTQEEAEQVPFIGELRIVLGLLRSDNFSAKSAAKILGQTPDDLYLTFHRQRKKPKKRRIGQPIPTAAAAAAKTRRWRLSV
jgi:hypothetical protein